MSQSLFIAQTIFTYSSLRKVFGKQRKTMEDAVKRQRKTIGNVAGKIKETAQARDEFKKIKNIQ